MHLPVGPDDLAAELLADGLMAEADPENGFLTGKGLYDVETYTSLGGCAGAGGNEHAVRIQFLRFGGGQLVIAENTHGDTQLAEVLDQVEGERIVVVDDQQHF